MYYFPPLRMKKLDTKSLYVLAFFISAICIPSMVFSQSISGFISDENNEPLIGATVSVVGFESNGTISDVDGTYRVSLDPGNYELVFSYIGYTSKSETVVLAAGQQLTLNVMLQTNANQLQEVVVVGYGVTRKGDIAGAITSVSSDDFNTGIMVSPEQLLQGKVSGVQISTTSGEPGAGLDISIRGINSIRGGSPLFVVDGIPLDNANTSAGVGIPNVGGSNAKNPLNFLNPSDIKSMQVLKDASATAIYGSRGANGVVIIETRGGSSGKNTIEYSGYVSTSEISNSLDLLDGDQYRIEQAKLDNSNNTAIILNPTARVDWQDLIFRTAISQNHNLSFSGGNDKTTYNASFGMLRQEGIVETNEYNRYNARLNLSNKYFDGVWKLDFGLIASHIQNAGVPISTGATGSSGGDLMLNAIRANPTAPDITTYTPLVGINPQTFLDAYHDNTETDRLLANVSSTVNILKGLVLKSKFAIDRAQGERIVRLDRVADSDLIPPEGRLTGANNENNNYLIDNFLTYNSSYGKLQYKVMTGVSYQSFERNNFFASYSEEANVFGNNLEDFSFTYDLDFSRQFLLNALDHGGGSVDFSLFSNIGRINLNWDDKYLLEATMRRDGSTRFSEANKFSFFPSVAFRWNLTNEAFFKGFNKHNNVALRASWGESGNQEIPSFSNIAERNIINGTGNLQKIFGNPNLIWETTSQVNLGIDFSLFDFRIYGNADYFNKETNDLLFRTVAASIGLPGGLQDVWFNSPAQIKSKGYEFLIGGYPISTEKFTWDLSFNLTAVNTTVHGLTADLFTGSLSGGGLSGATANIYQEGEELSFYLFDYQGFDNDGKIIYGNEGRKTRIRSVAPDFTFGINSNLSYGDFDMSMNWTGTSGLYLFNNTASSTLSYFQLGIGGNTIPEYIETQPSRFNSGFSSSSFYLEDADYIRLNNLQLGYTVRNNLIPGISKLRVYLSGQNLLIFTNYLGYDPEVNTDASRNGFASRGIDFSVYPKARTLLFGINLSI